MGIPIFLVWLIPLFFILVALFVICSDAASKAVDLVCFIFFILVAIFFWFATSLNTPYKVRNEFLLTPQNLKDYQVIVYEKDGYPYTININKEIPKMIPPGAKIRVKQYYKCYFGIWYPVNDSYEVVKNAN